MPVSISSLEGLIELRKNEREEDQRRYTQEMTANVDAALGPRVVAAIDPSHATTWEINHTSAMRRFIHRNNEYHLVVVSIHGASRVDVEIRHVDMRYAPLAKKAGIGDISEDWFLNGLETLAAQVQDRQKNPRNFT